MISESQDFTPYNSFYPIIIDYTIENASDWRIGMTSAADVRLKEIISFTMQGSRHVIGCDGVKSWLLLEFKVN